MLTPSEKSGLRDILKDLTDSDLFSVADTVTKRLLNVTDRSDAIQNILSCLVKPSDLLRRQKVTKKILFSYLLKIRSCVSPESSKHDLIDMCLREWNSKEECKENDYENNSNHIDSQQSSCNLPQSEFENNSVVDSLQSSSNLWISMGTEFAQWFFPMYNALTGFGPEHFWADCRLMGELKTANEEKAVVVVGAEEVTVFLISLIKNDCFYFDANTSSDSVTCEQEIHGLVRITISGVIHKMNNCVGLFDCFFGLVRNPACDYNWKIKWIQLKLHVTSCNSENLGQSSARPGICST